MSHSRSHRNERSRSRRPSRSRRSLAPLRRKRDGSVGPLRRKRDATQMLYDENKELHATNRCLHAKIDALQKESGGLQAYLKDTIYDLESRLVATSHESNRCLHDKIDALQKEFGGLQAYLKETIYGLESRLAATSHESNRCLHDKIDVLQKEFGGLKACLKDNIDDLGSCLTATSREARYYQDECATMKDQYHKQEAELQQQTSATTTAMRDLIENIIDLVFATNFVVLISACKYVHCRLYVFCFHDRVGLVSLHSFTC